MKEEFPNIQTVAVDLENWKETRAAVEGLKAGLDHMTRNMAAELALLKIRVNSVNQGPMDTDMLRETMEKIQETYPGMTMEKMIMISQMAMKISSVPTDHVVNLTLFLLSNSAACAIGNTVMADGGFYLNQIFLDVRLLRYIFGHMCGKTKRM